MASRAIKHPEKKNWAKPALRKLEGEEADRAKSILLALHGPGIFKNIKSAD